MMISRGAVAVGLGLVGMGLLVGPSLGQQQDGGVQKTTNTQASAGSAKRPPAAPAVIGTVDLGSVLKEYNKAKSLEQEFQSAGLAKRNDLLKINNEMQQEAEMLEKVSPNTAEFKKRQDKITQLKAQLEATREQAQRDMALRQSEMMSTIFNEIQDMVSRVAYSRNMNMVVKVSNEPITGSNPNSVMAAFEKDVLYANPQNDITREVVFFLNKEYEAKGGVVPKAATATAAPTRGGAAPKGRN
jgi:Skp family chaperone for outer membrane proteins